jgi:hypothetical protein
MTQPVKGDEVVLTDGPFQGHSGVVLQFDRVFGIYLVLLDMPDDTDDEVIIGARPEELDFFDDEPTEATPFGMSKADLAKYVHGFAILAANQMKGSDDKGYQDFEVEDTQALIHQILVEIESWAAAAAMAHIRVTRVLHVLKEMGVA